MSKRKRWVGRVYLGRDGDGRQLFHWVGRFDTRREREKAVAEARVQLKRGGPLGIPTCDEYVDRYLREYARRNKDSSHDVAIERLRRFRNDFAGRSLAISRAEIKDWMEGEGVWAHHEPIPRGYRPAIVTLYNHAIDEDDIPLERNPARKLGRRTKSKRSQTPPPTEAEFDELLRGCDALDEYAARMRALLLFAAYTLMRPSELYALEWASIDFSAMRVRKAERSYRGQRDEPKTGAVTIPLTPPARDAITGLPRDHALVFTSKTGRPLSQPTLSGYWGKVKARTGLDFDFYHATKHYGVHYMWTKLGMSPRAIAAQAGWKVSTVNEMLEIYGHGDVGALEEVDVAFARAGRTHPHLRKIEGGMQ